MASTTLAYKLREIDQNLEFSEQFDRILIGDWLGRAWSVLD